jgi:hypothetical protein
LRNGFPPTTVSFGQETVSAGETRSSRRAVVVTNLERRAGRIARRQRALEPAERPARDCADLPGDGVERHERGGPLDGRERLLGRSLHLGVERRTDRSRRAAPEAAEHLDALSVGMHDGNVA